MDLSSFFRTLYHSSLWNLELILGSLMSNALAKLRRLFLELRDVKRSRDSSIFGLYSLEM